MSRKRYIMLDPDYRAQLKLLTRLQLGELFEGIYKYDEDFTDLVTDDKLVAFAWTGIKQDMDRIRKAFEESTQKFRDGGKKGMASRWGDKGQGKPQDTSERDLFGDTTTANQGQGEQKAEPRKLSSVKGLSIEEPRKLSSVKGLSIEERRKAFKEDIGRYKEKYDRDMLNSFYNYWGEATRDGKKMRFEQQPTWETGKRLATWKKKEERYQ